MNALAPGAIETDFTKAAREHPEFDKIIARVTALGRIGHPDDVGPLVALLLDDATHWLTGQRIEASGGMNLGDGDTTSPHSSLIERKI